MKNHIFLPLVAVAGLLAVTGCKTTVNSVENAQKEGQRQMISDSRVITDSGLNKKVSIVGVNSTMTPGGLLKVQVELLNKPVPIKPSTTALNGLMPAACSSTTSPPP